MGRATLLASTAILFATGATTSVLAADADAAPAAATLTEIVVTARRHEENLERVPAAITALDASELRNKSVNTESDLQRAVPGLTVRASLTQNQLNYSIRGQTVDQFSDSNPGVLGYFNEVETDTLSPSTFYDLSSVQVLKGPQGTLFGRNTTGGAVLFTSNTPKDTFSGDFTARFGNYDDKEFQGDLNVPIIPGKVLLRVAASVVEKDGYVTDVFHNIRLGDTDTKSGRVTLLLKSTENFQNQTTFQYTLTGGTNLGGPVYSVPGCTTGAQASCFYNPAVPFWSDFLKAHPGAYPGGLTAFLQLQQQRGPYVADFNSPSNHAGINPILTNMTSYKINADLEVKNIFGYSLATSSDQTDVDGSPFPIFTYGSETVADNEVTHNLNYSDELQLQGKALDKNLVYILGAYYSYEKKSFYDPEGFFYLTPDVPAMPLNVLDNTGINKSEAVFFQGTYDLASMTKIEGLRLTGGFRYTFEQLRSQQNARSVFAGAPDQTVDFSDPSWIVGLDYQIRPDLLLYVTQRGSWRSGGFNGNAPPRAGTSAVGGTEFLPETTEDVEVGAKFEGRLGAMPFRLNVDAYNQWIHDIQRVFFFQIPLVGPTAITNNVPQAEVSGFEADTELRATPWLTIGGNVSFQNARFTQNRVALFGQVVNFGPYADAPKWNGSGFVELKAPIPTQMGEMTLRGDVYGRSKFFFSNLNNSATPGTDLPAYTLVNFRLNWSNIGGSHYGVAFFVNNAFDHVYYLGGLAVGNVLGINTAIPGSPRTYGVELRASF